MWMAIASMVWAVRVAGNQFLYSSSAWLAIWLVSSPMILMVLAPGDFEVERADRSCWNTVLRSLWSTAIPSWAHLEKESSGSFMGDM